MRSRKPIGFIIWLWRNKGLSSIALLALISTVWWWMIPVFLLVLSVTVVVHLNRLKCKLINLLIPTNLIYFICCRSKIIKKKSDYTLRESLFEGITGVYFDSEAMDDYINPKIERTTWKEEHEDVLLAKEMLTKTGVYLADSYNYYLDQEAKKQDDKLELKTPNYHSKEEDKLDIGMDVGDHKDVAQAPRHSNWRDEVEMRGKDDFSLHFSNPAEFDTWMQEAILSGMWLTN